jgi:predicted ATPase
VFAVYRNPFDTTPITETARILDNVRVYRDFKTDFRDGARRGIASDALKYPLDDDSANLALVLQEMDFWGSLERVKAYLKRLSSRFEDIKIRLVGGFAQLYIVEQGTGAIPATRLSDGTLRFLCLMAVLCDHDPPPLVCIEEPEVGLHPEALRLVAEALKEASNRMQIVVTTHSDVLVDYFSDQPEVILVCEKDTDESTRFKRLQRDQLQSWLEDYTLGDLWRRGGVGGTLQ